MSRTSYYSLLLVALLLLGAGCSPVSEIMEGARKSARRDYHKAALQELGRAYHQYHDIHRAGPPGWDALLEASGHSVALKKVKEDGFIVHWGYRFQDVEIGITNFALAYPPDALDSGGIVLFLDGHTQYLTAQQLQEALAAQSHIEPHLVSAGEQSSGEAEDDWSTGKPDDWSSQPPEDLADASEQSQNDWSDESGPPEAMASDDPSSGYGSFSPSGPPENFDPSAQYSGYGGHSTRGPPPGVSTPSGATGSYFGPQNFGAQGAFVPGGGAAEIDNFADPDEGGAAQLGATPPPGSTPVTDQTRLTRGARVIFPAGGQWESGEYIRALRIGVAIVRRDRDGRTISVPRDDLLLPGDAATVGGIDLEATVLRKWTDSTGRYEVVAKLADFANGQVTLRKADGSEITLPLERLSRADQHYVRRSLGGRQ